MTAAARSHKFSRTMRLASLALGYPDDQWWRDIPLTDTAAGSLSGPRPQWSHLSPQLLQTADDTNRKTSWLRNPAKDRGCP